MTLTLAALALLAPAASQAEPIVRSFEVQPGGELEVDTDTGSIEISGHDADEIVVEIVVGGPGAAGFEVDFRERGNGLQIVGKASRGLMNRRSSYVDVDYVIRVPGRFDVDLRTSGGSITVGDLDGDVRADTSGGSIDLGRITGEISASTSGGGIQVAYAGGDVSADTSGGSIRVDEAAGRVSADTSGGSIRMGSVEGPVNADTSGGSISVKAARSRVEASTSGGSIKVGFAAQPDGKSRLDTSGGTVTVYLADGISLDVRARSGVGVSSAFTLDDAEMRPGRLEGRLNGGGPLLDLRSSGRVRIEPM
jgi:DUF4097 and DUF4098 domain-containing protein YvlB